MKSQLVLTALAAIIPSRREVCCVSLGKTSLSSLTSVAEEGPISTAFSRPAALTNSNAFASLSSPEAHLGPRRCFHSFSWNRLRQCRRRQRRWRKVHGIVL